MIRDQSQIASLTRGPAPAGNITVTAGTLLVDSALTPGEQPEFTTGIISSAESGSSGDAGTVIVHADNLTLSGHHANISVSSFGSGKAGNIRIDAPNQMILENGSGVLASSLSRFGARWRRDHGERGEFGDQGSVANHQPHEGSGACGNHHRDRRNATDRLGADSQASSQSLPPALLAVPSPGVAETPGR